MLFSLRPRVRNWYDRRSRRQQEWLSLAVGGSILLIGLAYAYQIGFLAIPPLPWPEIVAAGIVVIGIASFIALDPGPDIVEVGIDGPIDRDVSPFDEMRVDADDVVETIETVEESRADAIYLELDSPGGKPVPSEDIRRAVAEADVPVVGHVPELCASGAYLIGSACDRVVAREGALVGSIGVIGSKVNAAELADEAGISYERFAAGDKKDAGATLKPMEDKDREYIQGLIDGHYDHFVDRVSAGRELAEEQVRETEARVFLAEQAAERSLIDAVGDKDDVIEMLGEQIRQSESVKADDLVTKTVSTSGSPFTGGALASVRGIAYSFGAGLGDRLVDVDLENDFEIKFR